MAKAKRRSQRHATDSPGIAAAVVRTVLTFTAAVAIILISAYLFARTDGFRSMVETRVASATGLDVEIRESKARWNGDLLLGGIRADPQDPHGTAGFRIEEARIGANWIALLRGNRNQGIRSVSATGWRVDFAPDRQGRMQPRVLISASTWLGKWGGLALPQDSNAEPASTRQQDL